MLKVTTIVAISPAFRLILQLFLGYSMSGNEFSQFSISWTAALFVLSMLQASSLTYFYHYLERNISLQAQTLQALSICIFASVVSCVSISLFYEEFETSLSLLFLFLVINSMAEFYRKANVKLKKYKKTLKIEVLYVFANVFFITLLSKAMGTFSNEVVLISFILSGSIYVYTARLSSRAMKNYELGKFIKFTLPLIAAALMQFMSGNYFILVANKYVSFEAIGQLSLMRNLFSPVILLLAVVDIELSSKYSNLNETGELKGLKKTILYYTACSIFGLLPFLSVAYLSQYLYDYSSFRDSVLLVSFMFFLAHVFIVFNRFSSVVVRAAQANKIVTMASFASFIVTFATTDLLGFNYGLLGLLSVMLLQQITMAAYLFYGLSNKANSQ